MNKVDQYLMVTVSLFEYEYKLNIIGTAQPNKNLIE